MTRALRVMAALGGIVCCFSCGYHVGGKADALPKGLQTISIPRFGTLSMNYQLADMLPQQIGREFLTRTRFRTVKDPSNADAVLNGTINTVSIIPTIYDPTSGKATSIQVGVSLTVNLLERSTGRVLFSRANINFRQSYDVATDPHQFFDESSTALDRLSRDVARTLVDSIVENF
ncbi:MAG: hypothetical protein JO033_03375 [Acidobacteriaceae bacterium]|nr:hypothetical protein [Acidobacteriaceae bacterium]